METSDAQSVEGFGRREYEIAEYEYNKVVRPSGKKI